MSNSVIEKHFGKTKSKNKIIIDGHSQIYRLLHSAHSFAKKEFLTEIETYNFFVYLFLKFVLETIENEEPDEFYIALDKGSSWRKRLYKNYKEQRKKVRKESEINFESFFQYFDEFVSDFENAFPNIKFLKTDNIEADDIISVFVENNKQHNIKIISSDMDFIQLLEFKNVSIFDPRKNDYLRSMNPKQDKLIKIIEGDKSDNIPAIKEKVGKKTAEKIVLNDSLEEVLKDEKIKQNFERNKKLIDMYMLPHWIKNRINDLFEEKKQNYKYNFKEIKKFLNKYKQKKILKDFQKYNKALSNLT